MCGGSGLRVGGEPRGGRKLKELHSLVHTLPPPTQVSLSSLLIIVEWRRYYPGDSCCVSLPRFFSVFLSVSFIHSRLSVFYDSDFMFFFLSQLFLSTFYCRDFEIDCINVSWGQRTFFFPPLSAGIRVSP